MDALTDPTPTHTAEWLDKKTSQTPEGPREFFLTADERRAWCIERIIKTKKAVLRLLLTLKFS
jgi:hypothetical protein